jgi:hypothetical protein
MLPWVLGEAFLSVWVWILFSYIKDITGWWRECGIWDSNSGGYEEYHLLGYNGV